jgi:crossover junction endodeoxyribonuclease RuvC
MRILGIDPGYAITGYSIIEYVGNKFTLIDSGAITTEAGVSFPLRLLKIHNELEEIIHKYLPEVTVVEELFFNQNVKPAIHVAQARGIILMTSCKNNIDTYEYTPLQVKQAVVRIWKGRKSTGSKNGKVYIKG